VKAVVLVRGGAVAGPAGGPKPEPERALLGQPEAEVRPLNAQVGLATVTAFVDHEGGVEEIGLGAVEPFGTVFAAGFLVGNGEEGEASPETQTLSLDGEKDQELDDGHALHVEGAAAPDETALDGAGEGRLLPMACLGRDDIGV